MTSYATPVLGVGHPGGPKSQHSPLSTREVVLNQWSLGHCWACSCVPHPPWDKCRIQKLVENWPGSCPMTLVMKKWGWILHFFISFSEHWFLLYFTKASVHDRSDTEKLHYTQPRKHCAHGSPRAPAALLHHPQNPNPDMLNGTGNPCRSLTGGTKAIVQALRSLALDQTLGATTSSGVAEETRSGLTGRRMSDPADSRGERPSSILGPKLSPEDVSTSHWVVSYCICPFVLFRHVSSRDSLSSPSPTCMESS